MEKEFIGLIILEIIKDNLPNIVANVSQLKRFEL
jgi:hypothetical protein